MGGAGAWARSILRRRWSGIGLLVLLAAAGLTVSMVAANGARRSASAYDRLAEETLSPDAFGGQVELTDEQAATLADLPGVAAFARFGLVPLTPAPLVPMQDGIALGSADPDFLTRILRPHVVDGRLADPDATDEIVVNEAMAEAGHLHPGQRVTLLAGFDHAEEVGTATVTGVVRTPFDVGPSAGNSVALLSAAVVQSLDPSLAPGGLSPMIRLDDGVAGIDRFEERASAVLGTDVVVQSAAQGANEVQESLRVQSTGYAVLAALAIIATILAIGQGFARLLGQAFVDWPALNAIGMRPRQKLRTGALIALPIAVLTPLLAVLASWLGSTLVPSGLARSTDPLTGRHLDGTSAAVLGIAWLVVVVGVAVLLAWREGRPRREAASWRRRFVPRPPDLRSRLGVDAALRSPGLPGGAAARSALVAASVGIAGVVAATTFTASLDHLTGTPRLQGWTYDAVIQTDQAPLRRFEDATAGLQSDPAVDRVTYATLAQVSYNGSFLETVALSDGPPELQPTIRAGRGLQADDEAVLGAGALDLAGVHIGETVTVAGQGGQRDLDVVGSAAYPMFGDGSDTSQLATISRATVKDIGAREVSTMAFVDLAPGHDADELSALADSVGGELITPFDTPAIKDLKEVRAFPAFISAFFALLALATIAHGLLRSVAVRRREFAELSALGVSRRDRRRILVAQGLTIGVTAGVLGLVFGTALGRWGWAYIAAGEGLVDETIVPARLLALIAALTLTMCVVTAIASPRIVRLRPSRDLRAAE